MAALKAIVVILGVLIVIGTGLLVYLLATGAHTGASVAAASGIALPKGAEVTGMAGLGDRLALHVKAPGAPDRIMIIDPARGRLLGTITLETKE